MSEIYRPSKAPDWHDIGPIGPGTPIESQSVGVQLIQHPSRANGVPTIIAFTDARRDRPKGRTEGTIGYQTRYSKLLPAGSPVIAIWTGAEANSTAALELAQHLDDHTQRLRPQRPVLLLTGGNHLHPNSTGTLEKAKLEDVAIYGGLDEHRDMAGFAGLNHNDANDGTFVGICRGYQLGLFHYGTIMPSDHGQEPHKVILSKDGGDPVYPLHKVRDILSPKIREAVRRSQGIEIPVIDLVNSAHAQGFKVSDIDEKAMKLLNEKGWYPWLVANIPGVKDEEQTYEGWIRVINGRIKGIMLQSHPEMDDAPYVGQTRHLIHQTLLANMEVPHR